MRLSILSLLGLAASPAIPTCPYAATLGRKSACSYGLKATPDMVPRAYPACVSTPDKQGVMFMNRISPSSSVLYVANAEGSSERQLLSEADSVFEYHASFSPDGKWITFTSKRAGDGQSDIYRVCVDGSQIEELIGTPSFEDAGVMSPDGTMMAYVSTKGNYTANIWFKNMETKEATNLTNTNPQESKWE